MYLTLAEWIVAIETSNLDLDLVDAKSDSFNSGCVNTSIVVFLKRDVLLTVASIREILRSHQVKLTLWRLHDMHAIYPKRKRKVSN